MASLVIRYLLKNGLGTLLAVDADPNANLGENMGWKSPTIGSILNEFQGENLPSRPA